MLVCIVNQTISHQSPFQFKQVKNILLCEKYFRNVNAQNYDWSTTRFDFHELNFENFILDYFIYGMVCSMQIADIDL